MGIYVKLIKTSDMRQPARTQMLAPFIWDCLLGDVIEASSFVAIAADVKHKKKLQLVLLLRFDLFSSCH